MTLDKKPQPPDNPLPVSLSGSEIHASPNDSTDVFTRIFPEYISNNLKRRVLPLGLARLLSLGTPVLLQLCLLLRFGPEEAGVYWILSSTIVLLVVISDAGAVNAFPVLFGPEPGREHPQLSQILRIRIFTAVIAACGLAGLGGVGKAVTSHLFERVVLFVLVIGRVFLMSHQGFHYARQRFDTLLVAAVAEFTIALTGFGCLAIFDVSGMGFAGRPATFTLLFLALATWIAIFILNVPAHVWGLGAVAAAPSPTLGSPSEAGNHPLAFLGPFALCAISGAIFTKGDALVAGFILDPASAGLLGTLEAFYRLSIFPIYMSGQGLFPVMRAAWLRRDTNEMARLTRLHRETGLRLMVLGLLLTGVAWFVVHREVPVEAVLDWRMGVLLYLIAIPVAIPNAFIMPDYFCRDQQWGVARLSILFALGRPFLAVLLAAKAGLVGMALNHVLFDLMQGAIFGVVMPWREGRFPFSQATSGTSFQESFPKNSEGVKNYSEIGKNDAPWS